MADITLTVDPQVWGEGVELGAFPVSNWPSSREPSGAPVGSAADTGEVDGGQVVFEGLSEGSHYWVTTTSAEGPWRYVLVIVPRSKPGGGGGSGAPPGTVLAHEWQTVSWNSGGAFWPLIVPGSVDITVDGNPDWDGREWLVGCEFTLDVETTVRLNFVCHSIGIFNTTLDVDFVIPTFEQHLPTGTGDHWHTSAAILSSPQAIFGEGEDHLMGLAGFSIPLNLDQYVKLPAGTHQVGVEAKTGDGADWIVQSVPTEPAYYPPYLRVEVADPIPPFPEVD